MLRSARRWHQEEGDTPQSKQVPAKLQADIGLLGDLKRIGRIYQVVSTCMNIFMFLQMSLILFVDTSADLWLTQYLRCWGPRILAHHTMTEQFMPIFSLVVSLNHLTWRALMVFIEGSFEFNLIPFLLSNEIILEKRLHQGAGASRLNNIIGKRSRSYSSDSPTIDGESMDLLDRSLYYKLETIHNENVHIRFRLRPNRGLRAKRQMIDKINSTFVVILVMAFVLGVITIPLGFYTGLMKHDHVWKDCPLKSDSVGLFRYTYRVAILIVYNFVFFFDQVVYTFVIGACGHVFVYDMIIYWRDIQFKVDWLYGRLIKMRDKSLDQRGTHQQPSPILVHDNGRFQVHQLAGVDLWADKAGAFDRDLYRLETVSLNREIVEVQSLLADFFIQLSLVDRFMSILVPIGLGTWLTCNIAITVSDRQAHLDIDIQQVLIRFFQAIIICLGAGVSVLVLKLKRSTEPMYPILCNIVTMDNRLNIKQWLKLLDIYTGRPRYAFTFWHGPIFTQATCIRILSYTLTLEVLLGSHRYA